MSAPAVLSDRFAAGSLSLKGRYLPFYVSREAEEGAEPCGSALASHEWCCMALASPRGGMVWGR
jgi:hypothetical protein